MEVSSTGLRLFFTALVCRQLVLYRLFLYTYTSTRTCLYRACVSLTILSILVSITCIAFRLYMTLGGAVLVSISSAILINDIFTVAMGASYIYFIYATRKMDVLFIDAHVNVVSIAIYTVLVLSTQIIYSMEANTPVSQFLLVIRGCIVNSCAVVIYLVLVMGKTQQFLEIDAARRLVGSTEK